MYIIKVRDLVKRYVVGERKYLIFRKKRIIEALKGVSFKIKKGEFVGYIGPNGAGKSTTIKVLTGILVPDGGEVNCMGFVPWKERIKYTKHIGVVLGQKSSLWWDLPVKDSLKLFKEVYGLSDEEYKDRLEFFDRMIGIKSILEQPVRKLSFGQRMKAEIVSSLLHKPNIVFLDEPTIGLDIIARDEIREFLKTINKKEKITIILTTHYLEDIEALCDRILLINNGKILYRGTLDGLKKKYGDKKRLEIDCIPGREMEIAKVVGSKKVEKGFVEIEGTMDEIKEIVKRIVDRNDVIGFNILEPRLEDVVRIFYES